MPQITLIVSTLYRDDHANVTNANYKSVQTVERHNFRITDETKNKRMVAWCRFADSML